MKKIIAACLLTLAATGAIATPAHAAADPAANKAAYWETKTPQNDVCAKTELTRAPSTYTLPALPSGKTYTLLVLKAGTENREVYSPSAGTAYMGPAWKGISHVIYCVGTRSSYPSPYQS